MANTLHYHPMYASGGTVGNRMLEFTEQQLFLCSWASYRKVK